LKNRTHTGILILVLAAGLAGCDGAHPPSPTAPSTPQPRQTPRPNPNGQGEYVADVTLSGVMYEVTPTGRVPVEGAVFWSSEQASGATDITGRFHIRPVWVCPCPWASSVDAGITSIYWAKDGYEDPLGQPDSIFPESIIFPGGRRKGEGWRDVKINGDTRFDIELVRR
jgi:hypothetical protein